MGRSWWRRDTFDSLTLDAILHSRTSLRKTDWLFGICDRCGINTWVKDTSFRKVCKTNNWIYLCEKCRYELFGYKRSMDRMYVSVGGLL